LFINSPGYATTAKPHYKGDNVRIGIAADHGGFELKAYLTAIIQTEGHEVVDFGAKELNLEDDYPDYVIPLARAVANGDLTRGIALCNSGVGACIAVNKVRGVRAALITDSFSAHQGVEDDNMNVICLGGQVIGRELAWDLVKTFLNAQFNATERFTRRLAKITELENRANTP
jgi:ribose 5-phosphate isomerase B